jgi:hypothetical protein
MKHGCNKKRHHKYVEGIAESLHVEQGEGHRMILVVLKAAK